MNVFKEAAKVNSQNEICGYYYCSASFSFVPFGIPSGILRASISTTNIAEKLEKPHRKNKNTMLNHVRVRFSRGHLV